MMNSTWSLLFWIFIGGILIEFSNSTDNNGKTNISILIDCLELVEQKLARLERKLKLDVHNDNLIAFQNDGESSANQIVAEVPRSCLEALTSDPEMESGTYFIDPDGSDVGDGPIEVYCNVTTGMTIISHDSEAKTATTNCVSPGCYSKEVTYTALMKQMKALMEISKECQQLIKYECLEAPLEHENVQYSYWNDSPYEKFPCYDHDVES